MKLKAEWEETGGSYGKDAVGAKELGCRSQDSHARSSVTGKHPCCGVCSRQVQVPGLVATVVAWMCTGGWEQGPFRACLRVILDTSQVEGDRKWGLCGQTSVVWVLSPLLSSCVILGKLFYFL